MQYFLNAFGNFENLVKIWTRRPPNYYQNASKNARQNMDSSWEILLLSIWDIKHFENCRDRYVLGTRLFSDFCSFFDVFLVFFWVYILKIILRRWGIENDTFFIIKQHPNLDLNFISIKNHERDFTLNFVFLRNAP